jgi:hypothetical protein
VKDIPNDFEAFTTNDNKKYLNFKDNKLIILQSEKMLEILDSFPEEIFIDSTFKIVTEPFYQLLILRVFDPFHNSFHTIAFALMVKKSKFLYMKALIMLKCEYKKIKKLELNPKNWHCDFEEGLSAAIKECFLLSQIKYCFFHYGQIIFRKINSFWGNWYEY